MRVMITGSAGLLGKALIQLVPVGVDLVLTYRNVKPEAFGHTVIQADLNNSIDLAGIRPDVVIHCATEGNVDKIQQHAYLGVDCILNPTVNLIKEVKKVNARFIYVSTNAVFNGCNPPYDDNSPLSPINSYGIFKAACELAVQGNEINWNIVRPILMYGWPNHNQRSNWVPIWIDKLRKGEVCNVVYDVVSQPLYNIDCADVIWKIVCCPAAEKIHNVAGAEPCSLYDLALVVAEEIGADKTLVRPVPSSFFKSLAPRPKDTSYTNRGILNLGHRPIGIREGVKAMLKEKPC